jgi:LEA14-like dessication related protein
MKKLLSFTIFTLFILLTACKKPQSFDYRGIKNIKVSHWGTDSSRVSLDLVYFNPNKYGVNLKNVNADVSINQVPVGHIVLDTSMHIPGAAEFTVPASMNLNLKTLLNSSINMLLNNDVTIGAKGTTRVGKGGVFVTIPFSYEGKQKLNLF